MSLSDEKLEELADKNQLLRLQEEKGKGRMRRILNYFVATKFLTISKVVSTEKKSSILRKKFITFTIWTLVFILEKS